MVERYLDRNAIAAQQARPGRSFLPGQPGNQPAISADQVEWDVVLNYERYAAYKAAAAAVGLKFGPPYGLRPQLFPATTAQDSNTEEHQDIPIALNVNVPSRSIQWIFDAHYFITRVTYAVTGLTLTADGQPEAGYFTNEDPGDYVFIDLQRDNGDKYTITPVTLRQFAGYGGLPYLFGLVPVVERGTRLLGTVSILPPWSPTPAEPPFVVKAGMVQVTFHVERFEPWR